MFAIDGKLIFINVEQSYLKKLHGACSEIYYREDGYENKPYIGILINNDDKKYVIPLSSAKAKHRNWKNVDRDCYLIYEMADKSHMSSKDIWVDVGENTVKHILAIMDVKKMIPIVDGVYSMVNINPKENDTADERKYKDLLNKEYIFCLKIMDDITAKAGRLYDRQMRTGKVAKFCCDFKKLEQVASVWNRKVC